MIAVDWGTSSFRAYRLNSAGEMLEQRSQAVSLLASKGKFDQILAEQLQGWDDALIVMTGMVGSRNGWVEVPYVECPANSASLRAQAQDMTSVLLPGRRIKIVPGLCSYSQAGSPEVMRGEEMQLVGLLDTLGAGMHTVCLPGTHSKWAVVKDGVIQTFRTAMTGEMYAVLKQHSILGAQMVQEACAPAEDESAFGLGVKAGSASGGLLNQLFSVRTQGLFSLLSAPQLPAYLSGILIGNEIAGLLGDAQLVHLVGNDALVERYQKALRIYGVATKPHGEFLAAQGLYKLGF
jgi:2-dehydro-3-deoxygalactonokinase